jgi:hypothetical protein
MSTLEALSREVALLRAERAVTRLQTSYGYYVDKGQWDEAADLFARDATLEIAARGLFRGQDRIRAYLHHLPPLAHGTLFNHTQLQPLVTIADDLKSACGRWRAIMLVGLNGTQELMGDAVYENAYIVEDGIWKIAKLHAFVTHYVDMDGKPVPMGTVFDDFPPDEPQTVNYASFPSVYIPPYHYPNPVTGKIWKEEQSA